MSQKFLFVTGNKHKLEEVQKALPDFTISGEKIDLPEIQGWDVENIVRMKVLEACRQLQCPVIVDDTSVYIEAFNGFPGPYAADWQKVVGNERTLQLLRGFKKRNASMVCRAAYCEPGQEPVIFEGKVEGFIATQIRGKEGFGFDPIFIPERSKKTTPPKCDTEPESPIILALSSFS